MASQDSAPLTVQDALKQGIACHQAGQLQEAERHYRAILQVQPHHADANHNLGVVAVQVNRAQAGLPHFKAALESNPNQAQYWLSYIDALIQAGQTEVARDVLEQGRNMGVCEEPVATLADRLADPSGSEPNPHEINSLEASFNEGRYAEAETLARKMTERFPAHGFGWKVLGASLHMQGRDALPALQEATKLFHDDAESFSNLGVALRNRGQLDDAVASYRRALEIEPGYPEAHNNLGYALKDLGQLDDAVASYRRALEIRPDYAEVHYNLGAALIDLGKIDDGLASYRRALKFKPDYAEAYNNIGIALLDLDQLDDAVASLRRALKIKPDYAEAYNNLGIALLDLGRIDDAVASLRRALEIKPDFAKSHSDLLFTYNYLPHMSAGDVFAEHQRWERQQALRCRCVERPVVNRNPQRRLRVGYVSPDLRRHSVAYFLEPLLLEHDRDSVEVFCYAEVRRPDPVTFRLQALADHWLGTVGMSDEALAQRIADDRIDILVDLAGHTAHNRLLVFARKPAPVQVTWLGYPHSTGLHLMDYRLVDEITDPTDEADASASETLVRLENGFLCYRAPLDAPQPSAPPSLMSGNITFGSFNNPAKLSSTTLDAWAILLNRVPCSRFLAKGKLFADAAGQAAFLLQLQQRGVDIGRVTLIGPTSGLADHLALYNQVDIALDPFPYNGTTTTCEALWMGVPVVTLRGDRHAGRVGASLLTQIGMPELIAASVEAYIDIAAALADDASHLNELRRTLRARMWTSPLCAAPAFARKMEAAYRTMWHRYCASIDRTMLTLINEVRIVVPNSLEMITPYVLQEQLDWFEDEIKFLRRLLQPGQKVIDIGANYGVYTLSMAHSVGSTGSVWAFEPASATAALLAQGIAANGFSWIVLERSAVSSTCGTARLSLNENPELNALVRDQTIASAAETVPLVTLDECLERHDWQDIDFIKIDAEGEEVNILKGGARFFAKLSPLVQYEIRAGSHLHMELVGDFAALGYASYRLVPGLDLLVPFEVESRPDEYLLNLFCCKRDCAERLAARGYLLEFMPQFATTESELFRDIKNKVIKLDAYGWRNAVTEFPYGVRLADVWEKTMATEKGGQLEDALSFYAFSRDSAQSSMDRFCALGASYSLLRTLCEGQPATLRLASLARAAKDYGARSIAINALHRLGEAMLQQEWLDLTEPFLAPGVRFDDVSPGEAVGDWVLAAVLEELELLGSYSSFYSGVSAHQRLEMIRSLGYGSSEMERRLLLLQERFDLPIL